MQSNMKHGTSDYYFGDKYSNLTNPQPSSAGQQSPPQSQSAGSSSVPQQSQPQGGQQIPSPQSSSSSFNCAGRRNGYYVKQQCGPDFYSCSNGWFLKEISNTHLSFSHFRHHHKNNLPWQSCI
jgi:hypothetical protein